MAVDAANFANGLVEYIDKKLSVFVQSRPSQFSGKLLVLNTGPIDCSAPLKSSGVFSTKTW